MVPSVSAPTAVRQNMPAELLSVKNLENPSQRKHLIWVSNWTEAGLTRLCTTWNGSADMGMADGFAEAKKASSLCLQHSCGSIISKSFGVVKKPRTPVLFQALLLIQIFGQQSTVQEQRECNQKKKKRHYREGSIFTVQKIVRHSCCCELSGESRVLLRP